MKTSEHTDQNEADKGEKNRSEAKRQCRRCGELGHGETSYKCSLNGTKKRKRKSRTNTTKNSTKKTTKKGKDTDKVSTKENIVQNSPSRVTRR